MLTRFGLCLLLISLLSACSSVPERYAPWRDNGDVGTGKKPNLADVPAAPNTQAAKAEIDTMRQRLEQDRNNAYLAAQGIIPVQDVPPPVMPVVPTNNIQGSDLPPANPLMATSIRPAPVKPAPKSYVPAAPAPAPIAAPAPSYTQTTQTNLAPIAPAFDSAMTPTNLPAPVAEQPAVMTNSNVLYNYDPNVGNEYTYGTNARNSGGSVQVNPASAMVANNDPSISVDWSALGGDTSPAAASVNNAQLAYNGVTLGEPVAYFAHGSANLTAKDKKAIQNLAKQLKHNPQPVMIAGNASKRTGLRNTALSREVNLKMSAKRASTVMNALVKQGVSPEKIYISAYGDSIPNRRRGASDEAADRRVEVIFDK